MYVFLFLFLFWGGEGESDGVMQGEGKKVHGLMKLNQKANSPLS